MKEPLKLVRPNIRALQPYSTARDDFKGGDISVWLDANESPYDTGFNRYPDPHQRQLKKLISELKGVSPDRIFIGGAGSDEAIDLTFRIFCVPGRDNAVAITPSYGVYGVAAAINDVELREVRLGDGFSLPVGRLLKATDRHTKLMFICSPNNPTANAFDTSEIELLAELFDGMVVVDEAYVDFSPRGSMLSMLDRHPNLIVLQTFSKAWGLASLRAGMAFAAPEIARIYGMVKYPYNMNGPTQTELAGQLSRDISAHVSEIISQRRSMAHDLSNAGCVLKVWPSDANFLLVKVADADAVYDYLVDNGVIVRNRSRLPGCEQSLRITVGTPVENRRVISLMQNFKPIEK